MGLLFAPPPASLFMIVRRSMATGSGDGDNGAQRARSDATARLQTAHLSRRKSNHQSRRDGCRAVGVAERSWIARG